VIGAKNLTEPLSLRREQVCSRATGRASYPTNQPIRYTEESVPWQLHRSNTDEVMNGEMGRLCKEINP
jgi:hypothetical protein